MSSQTCDSVGLCLRGGAWRRSKADLQLSDFTSRPLHLSPGYPYSSLVMVKNRP